MVGTTISMQNTKQMLYPSITFCESTTSARLFAGESWYASWYAFHNKTISSLEFEDLFINDKVELDGEYENAFSLHNSSSSSTIKSTIDVLARTATEKEDWIKFNTEYSI